MTKHIHTSPTCDFCDRMERDLQRAPVKTSREVLKEAIEAKMQASSRLHAAQVRFSVSPTPEHHEAVSDAMWAYADAFKAEQAAVSALKD